MVHMYISTDTFCQVSIKSIFLVVNSKGKQVATKHKEDDGNYSEFILTHFPRPLLRKQFLDNIMPRSVITRFFVNLSNLENLEICDKSIKDFLIAMGWKNVLVVNEHY